MWCFSSLIFWELYSALSCLQTRHDRSFIYDRETMLQMIKKYNLIPRGYVITKRRSFWGFISEICPFSCWYEALFGVFYLLTCDICDDYFFYFVVTFYENFVKIFCEYKRLVNWSLASWPQKRLVLCVIIVRINLSTVHANLWPLGSFVWLSFFVSSFFSHLSI